MAHKIKQVITNSYAAQIIHSDHENTILSAQTFLNQQSIQLKTIEPYQHYEEVPNRARSFLVNVFLWAKIGTIYSNNSCSILVSAILYEVQAA